MFNLFKKKDKDTVLSTAQQEINILDIKNNLRPSTIILTEKSTTNHYILNTKEFEISVEFGKSKEIEISNQHKKGNLRVFKVDKDNNRVALGNVEFDLYSEEYQKVIGTYRTDVNRRNLCREFKNWRL